METAVFKAVCPLEIGDTVAIGVGKTAAGVRTAYYLPAGMEVVVAGTVSIHTVTDISTTHYLKSGKTVFRYELNGSGRYEVLNVKVPVRGNGRRTEPPWQIKINTYGSIQMHKYTSVRLCKMSIAFILP